MFLKVFELFNETLGISYLTSDWIFSVIHLILKFRNAYIVYNENR